MNNVIIFGATGSIGGMCLDVISSSKSHKIVGITGYNQSSKLEEIKKTFNVPYCCSLKDTDINDFINNIYSTFPPTNTTVINAIDGFAGLKASVSLINYGYDIILANKETIVCGGSLFLKDAKNKGINIIPIDSEMYALETLISLFDSSQIEEYIITASGGPFCDLKRNELHNITYDKAIKHPVWKMGKNISLNSATLLNKALEIIEARNLFNIPKHKIKVVIHKEGYVHSLIKLKNGVVYPQVYPPTQKVAIANALDINYNSSLLNYPKNLTLSFNNISEERFPFIKFGFECLNSDAKAIVLNAAGEKATELFKNRNLAFDEIESFVEHKLNTIPLQSITSYDDIYSIDRLARS